MKQTIILAILDGWGIGNADESNPIYTARPQNINFIQKNFPCGALNASGVTMGLGWEEPGSSEMGHLAIGTGRIIYEHCSKINAAIQDNSFFENYQFKKAFEHSRQSNSNIHIIGLLSKDNIHSSINHLLALIEMAKKESSSSLLLHLITDGKDDKPRESLKLINQIQKLLEKNKAGRIASIGGRFYGMNGDESWELTEKTYNALLGKSKNAKTPEEAIMEAYKNGLEDEFIEPITIGEPVPIKNNDAVIFFNFREDDLRQLSEPIINSKFNKFQTQKLSNLFVVTMTKYHGDFESQNIAFPPEIIENSLGQLIANSGMIQLRITETEKQNHITYFFNGLQEKPLQNEYRVIIPSIKTPKPETHPEMRTSEITDRVLLSLNEGVFDFILINYASPDVIAHTGDFDAAIKSIKIIDENIGRLLKKVLSENHILILVADHGNADKVLNLETGEPDTKHSLNPVPFFMIAQKFQKQNALIEQNSEMPVMGILSDVAPTILELMKIQKPKEMTGESLLTQLI